MKRYTDYKTNFSAYLLEYSNDSSLQDLAPDTFLANSANIPCFYKTKSQPHFHEDHEINVVTRGAGYFTLENGKKVKVSAGDVFVIPGGVAHHLDINGRILVKGFYIHPNLFIGLDYKQKITFKLISDHQLFNCLTELFEQTLVEYARNDEYRNSAMQAIGTQAAIYFLRIMETQPSKITSISTQEQVAKVKAWIDRHFLEPIVLKELARLANLSLSHFCSSFKSIYGISPKAYVLRLRIQQAIQLLEETDLSITDIAFRAGFESLSHFSRLFKGHTNLNPKDFHKKHQKDNKIDVDN